jgi:hypothetical protein
MYSSNPKRKEETLNHHKFVVCHSHTQVQQKVDPLTQTLCLPLSGLKILTAVLEAYHSKNENTHMFI